MGKRIDLAFRNQILEVKNRSTYKLILFTFVMMIIFAACDSEPVEVIVTREVEKVVEVEVTREVEVEVEVPQIVIVTPAGETESAATEEEETAPTQEPEPTIDTPRDETSPTTLRISHELIWGGNETLDPYAPTRFDAYSRLAYERLVRLDSNGELVPVLATEWSTNSDGTAWTFTIRDGVTFHDGSPLTLDDVVYSIQRMIDANSNSTLQPVMENVAGVEALTNTSITLVLNEPDVEFPILMTDPRAVILKQDGGATIETDGLGTGPFKLIAFNVTKITDMAVHDGYWNGQPGVEQVELIAIPSATARLEAMLAEQIDMLDDIPADQRTQYSDPNLFTLLNVPTGDWRGFVMRTDTAPFDDPAVRQALRVVADRQAMVDSILGGAGTVACDTPVWSGDRYHTPIECAPDVELAQSLLAEAGYPNGIDVTIATAPLDPYWLQMVRSYAQQAAEAGIRVSVSDADPENFWTDTWLIDPFITTSWNQRPAPAILNEAWRSDAPWNETYWNNSEFDALLAEAAAEPDLALRKTQYAQLQTILWESGGAFIPFHLNETRVVSTCVAGVQPINLDQLDFASVVKTPNCN
ncbi:MAG: ABC transporter substrate-binding protein [Chloroflexota bacterium]